MYDEKSRHYVILRRGAPEYFFFFRSQLPGVKYTFFFQVVKIDRNLSAQLLVLGVCLGSIRSNSVCKSVRLRT